MADFISIGKPISFARPISLDVRFGPFESVAAAYQNVGPNGLDAIYAGLPFCVVANNKVEFYKWTKTTNPTVNDVEKIVPDLKTINGKLIVGNGDIVIKDVIVIAGVKTSGTELSGTGGTGDATTVYYYSDKGVLGLSINGGTSYYTRWANEGEFGTFMIWDPNYSSGTYTGNLKGVVPLINRLYLDSSTGDVKFASDKELQEVGSSFVPTNAQENAMNSGITKAKVNSLDALIALGLTSADITELRRLKNMGIAHDAENDLLTINKKQYDLSGGSTPVVITYGTPVVSISYPTISNNGGTYYPTISVSQPVNYDGVLHHNEEYDDVDELVEAIGQANVVFSYYDSSTTRFASFDSETGRLEADENVTENTKTSRIKINITMHDVSATADCTVTQNASSTQNKLYVTKVEYKTAATSNGDGSSTMVPTFTASDGNEYTVAQYTALGSSNIESFTFVSGNTYGATLNASTGAVTFNLSTMISDLAAGSYIKNILIDLNQENSSHTRHDIQVNFFDYDASQMTELLTINGVRGGSDGERLYKGESYGLSAVTLSLNPGDVVVFKTTLDRPVYTFVFETRLKLVTESGGVAVLANSSNWTTNGATNYNTFVRNVGGKETRLYTDRGDTELIYKALGNVTYTDGTVRVTVMYHNMYNDEGNIYYKKLN